jgi:hypothetical protein
VPYRDRDHVPGSHHVIVIATAKSPQCFDAFGRAVQTKSNRDGVHACHGLFGWMNNSAGLTLPRVALRNIVIRNAGGDWEVGG